MKLVKALIGLGLACALCCGCASAQAPKTESKPTESSSVASEEEDVMREYSTVEEVAEDHFVVKTTKDQLYWLDLEYCNGFEVGDFVLVCYDPAQKIEDGDHFTVTPTRVEASSTVVEKSMAG
jgi:hypothetical protein